MIAKTETTSPTVAPRALGLSEWWQALNGLLAAEYLEEASFAVARPYFQEGYTPEEAYLKESAIQARMLAA